MGKEKDDVTYDDDSGHVNDANGGHKTAPGMFIWFLPELYLLKITGSAQAKAISFIPARFQQGILLSYFQNLQS